MKGAGVGYDVIVAGGGSVGCVATARLSADDRCCVCCSRPGLTTPAAGIFRLTSRTDRCGHQPRLGFHLRAGRAWAFGPAARGRLMDGCSARDARFALRGWRHDYDQWAAMGTPGWSFADLLPVFRAFESDADFGGDWHGSHGPVHLLAIGR